MASITTRRRKGGSEAKRDDAAKRATVEAKRDDAAKRAAVEAKADEYAMTDSESDDDDEPSAESLTAARLALGGLEHSMTDLIGEPPAWLTASLAFLGPKVDALLGALEVAYEIAAPFVAAVAAVAALYVTREGAEVALGLLACVYGGSFTKVIAVAEALNVTGTWASVRVAAAQLRAHVEVVVRAERADSGRESMAGLHDRGEMGRIVARKLRVSAAAIRDPKALSGTLSALWSAAATVAAALRVRFARTLVLGVSLAEVLRPLALRELAAPLAKALDRDHRQWAPTLVEWGVKLLTVTVAYNLARYVAAWHSACRGGAVAAKAALKYAKRKGYAPARLALATDERPYRGSDGTGPLAFGLYADELLGFALAAFGAKVQFTKGFRLPPLLKLLLLPARLVEGFLAVAFVGLA